MSRRNQLNRNFFDRALVQPVGRQIYALGRARQPPAQSTATKFFRNLDQLTSFEGPLSDIVKQPSMRVLVAGCSMGCEAFSIAAFLAVHFPALDWHIDASDIADDALAVAKAGVYGSEHGLGSLLPTRAAELEHRLFARQGERWFVRDDMRARVSFANADVLAADFSARTGYDLVFGQNFMIHMSAADEARAFSQLVAVTRQSGALFVGGMDLDRRPCLVQSHGLTPVNWKITDIHNADDMRRSAWPWSYWSLEPIDLTARPFLERYCTIYWKRN